MPPALTEIFSRPIYHTLPDGSVLHADVLLPPKKPATDGTAAGTPPAPVQHFSRDADTGGGRWVTIGGTKGEDGKRKGGTPVYIKGGRIEKGHPSLVGRKIDALKEPPEVQHRDDTGLSKKQIAGRNAAETKAGREHEEGYRRAVWGKKAKEQGIPREHLHQLAAEILAHDHAYHADVQNMLASARKSAASFGTNLNRSRDALQHDDYTTIPHFDQIAVSAAYEHPELFPGFDPEVYTGYDPRERLYELLRYGAPEPMSEDDAYDQALAHLVEQKQGETVPF